MRACSLLLGRISWHCDITRPVASILRIVGDAPCVLRRVRWRRARWQKFKFHSAAILFVLRSVLRYIRKVRWPSEESPRYVNVSRAFCVKSAYATLRRNMQSVAASFKKNLCGVANVMDSLRTTKIREDSIISESESRPIQLAIWNSESKISRLVSRILLFSYTSAKNFDSIIRIFLPTMPYLVIRLNSVLVIDDYPWRPKITITSEAIKYSAYSIVGWVLYLQEFQPSNSTFKSILQSGSRPPALKFFVIRIRLRNRIAITSVLRRAREGANCFYMENSNHICKEWRRSYRHPQNFIFTVS